MKPHHFKSDKTYLTQYNLLLKDRRKKEDDQILGNVFNHLGIIRDKKTKLTDSSNDPESGNEVMQQGFTRDKKTKLVDSSNELVSGKVNYKLEMMYRSYFFVSSACLSDR